MSARRNDTKPYNPPEPIIFSDLDDSENATERPCFDTTPPAPKDDLLLASGGVIPAPVAQWLRNYQIEGVEYMYRLWKEGRGGILGDDMGLGSTPPSRPFLCDRFNSLFRNGAGHRVFNGCFWKTRNLN
jgi:SNF2 family DNA or RNA helicase